MRLTGCATALPSWTTASWWRWIRRALKAAVPGENVIEVQFEAMPADWEQRLRHLESVATVQPEGAGMYRILSNDGTLTTTQVVAMALHDNVKVKSLSVQSTTLDD